MHGIHLFALEIPSYLCGTSLVQSDFLMGAVDQTLLPCNYGVWLHRGYCLWYKAIVHLENKSSRECQLNQEVIVRLIASPIAASKNITRDVGCVTLKCTCRMVLYILASFCGLLSRKGWAPGLQQSVRLVGFGLTTFHDGIIPSSVLYKSSMSTVTVPMAEEKPHPPTSPSAHLGGKQCPVPQSASRQLQMIIFFLHFRWSLVIACSPPYTQKIRPNHSISTH